MAAALIHIARTRPVSIDSLGKVVLKETSTLAQMLRAGDIQPRIIPDVANVNTANYPTIDAYLALEAAAGYVVRHMDNTTIVTYATTVP